MGHYFQIQYDFTALTGDDLKSISTINAIGIEIIWRGYQWWYVWIDNCYLSSLCYAASASRLAPALSP